SGSRFLLVKGEIEDYDLACNFRTTQRFKFGEIVYGDNIRCDARGRRCAAAAQCGQHKPLDSSGSLARIPHQFCRFGASLPPRQSNFFEANLESESAQFSSDMLRCELGLRGTAHARTDVFREI